MPTWCGVAVLLVVVSANLAGQRSLPGRLALGQSLLVGTAIGFTVRSGTSTPYPGLLYPAAGMVLGFAVGVHWYSHRRGVSAPLPMTLLGATLGLVGLYAAPITVPLGATLFHNGAWRD